MSLALTFNSSQISNSTTSDLTSRFENPLYLGGLDWECALVKANLWYFHFNLVSKLFRYTRDDGSLIQHDITFPDGIYSLTQINDFIQATMREDGHTTTDADGQIIYPITLTGNPSTGKVGLTLVNPPGVTFQMIIPATGGSLGTILGFNAGTYSGSTVGANVADINNGVDAWQLRCDLVNGSYDNGSASQILYQFTPRSAPGSNIEIEPINPLYLQVNKSTISSVRVWMTDQSGNALDFHGEDMIIMLHLRKLERVV